MKKILFSTLILSSVMAYAQGPWKMVLSCKKEKIDLSIDLYDESIEVPTMEMFGPMNGYLGGNIYGVWYVTSYKIKDNKNATIKLANDLGSENQKIVIEQMNDTLWKLQFTEGNAVRRVNGKKLVKIPNELLMEKK